MSQALYYRAQAEAAEQAATEATLDNVRDRCLRSAAVWNSLAARAESTDRMRAEKADGAAVLTLQS